MFPPIFVCVSSLNSFTNYKFDDEYINKKFEFKGKILLGLVSFILLSLSYIISRYFMINIDLLNKLFFNSNSIFSIGIHKQIFLIFIISILLIIKNTKLFLKKLILLNFFICSAFIWVMELNGILIDDKFLINNYLNFDNLNFINIFYILLIEIIYYFWAFFLTKVT